MEFPVWHFIGVSSGLVIAVVSVLHVFIAQFAVGGGIFLVWMERKAYRQNIPELLAWLERHTHFFLLVTMVFGGISGVGIWFSICAVNPAGTSMLIHNFVFFWAAEWSMFLLEVAALLAYAHTYPQSRDGRLSARTHQSIGLVYAVSGFASLVLINGIITFMLTPGTGLSSGNVWRGFFNPTFFPSLITRTGICLMLAGMFALFTAPRIVSRQVRRLAIRASSLWVMLSFFPMAGGSAWYYAALPPDRQAAILRRTTDIRPFFEVYGWVLPVVFLAGVLAFARAERLRRPLAVLILAVGLTLVGSFEWVREAGRRPWIAEGYMYSNGVNVAQAAQARTSGTSSVSGWLRTLEAVEKGELKLPLADDLSYGAMLFSMQCGVCHGLDGPRLDIVPRARRLTVNGLEAQLQGLGTHLDAMPPFAGNVGDRKALADYLESAAHPRETFSTTETP